MDHSYLVTLCQACRTLLSPEGNNHGDQSSSNQRKSYRYRETLKRSVDQGCFICNRIWERLDLVNEDSPVSSGRPEDAWILGAVLLHKEDSLIVDHCSLDIFIPSSVLRRSIEKRPEIVFILESLHGTNPTSFCSIYHLRMIEFQTQGDGARERLPESTSSPETFSIATEWIANCLKNHSKCNDIATAKDWYPTRLLDCGSAADSDPLCTLVETRTSFITGPYMTLSHCWGRADCIKLTTNNYAQMANGISLSQLPQLYKDAVHVTRSLGARYLWIDSLCIIQHGDDDVDKHREVTLMSKVYSNSFCNISAGDAPDANHSLFCTRDGQSHPMDTVDYAYGGLVSRSVISESGFWDAEVNRALVNTRGWVLQERLLCPRLLHFGKLHLVWECKEEVASDAYPERLPGRLSEYESVIKMTLPDPRFPKVADERAWSSIVSLYTACNLTFIEDRLVALSALARFMGNYLKDEYVAGMWRRTLEHEMLWYIDDSRGFSRPVEDLAPTWSWVAAMGHVVLGVYTRWGKKELFIEVEDVHLEYTTEDTWGTLEGGWLDLRGTLNKLSLVGLDKGWIEVNGVRVPVDKKGRKGLKISLDAPIVESQNADLYCMLARVDSRWGTTVEVLLFELVDGDEGIFTRIGLAHGRIDNPQEIFLSPCGKEDEFPCQEYEDGEHVICIF